MNGLQVSAVSPRRGRLLRMTLGGVTGMGLILIAITGCLGCSSESGQPQL